MNKNRWIKAIAILEIFGGIFGLVLLFIWIQKIPIYNSQVILFAFMFLTPFIFSLIGGIMLLKNIQAGITISIILQLLQIPRLSIGPLLYGFFSGLQLGFIFFKHNIRVLVNIGGDFQFGYGGSGFPFSLGINLVALIISIYLIKNRKIFLFNIGAIHDNAQYDKAISDFTKALEINPRDDIAYHNRGVAYCKKDQHDQAISDFTKALEINSRYAKAYFNRGFTYYLKKEYDQSWEDVNRAKDLGYKISAEFLEDLRKASGRER